MSVSRLSPLPALLAAYVSAPMHPPTSLTDDSSTDVRCTQVRASMRYREALALMGRTPDSTLSGHTAAGPGGDPPAGSFAIDFWNWIDAQGRQRVCSLRYSGGVIDSVDHGQPADDPASPPLPHLPGT